MLISGGVNSGIGSKGKLISDGNSVSAVFRYADNGLIIDPSRIGTLFQDDAGTTPVSADGQSVGMIKDISGRGNHVIQSLEDRRPALNVIGGISRISFDGINDTMVANSVSWGGSDEVTIVISASSVATGIQSGLIRGGGLASPTRFGIIKQSDNRMNANSAGTIASSVTHGSIVTGSPEVWTVIAKIGAPSLILRHNGIQSAISTTSQGTGGYLTSNFFIASWGGGQFFSGGIYCLFAINRILTNTELAQVEKWASIKAGV